MWSILQNSIRGSFLSRMQSTLMFWIRATSLRMLAVMPSCLAPAARTIVEFALWVVVALQQSVSKQMLTSLELAVEYWNALSFSPQVGRGAGVARVVRAVARVGHLWIVRLCRHLCYRK